MSHRIVFQPAGKQGEAPDGMSVLDAARALGIGIENICGGRQTCAKCKVRPIAGEFAKYAITSDPVHLTAPDAQEAAYRAAGMLAADERLACSAHIHGDVVVSIPPEAQAQKQVIEKAARERVIDIDPAVRQVYVEVAQVADRQGDWERLQAALTEQWGFGVLALDTKLIPVLGTLLRAENWKVTVAVWQEREVIRVRPGYAEGTVGLAVDLGTTTLVAHLCDLRTGATLATATAMNPQIAYGEDLMSRVSYGMVNANGADTLHRAVIKALNSLASDAAKAAGLRADDILEMVVVGNTIMHHLFLGIDPVELGGAPFALTIRESLDLKARDLGLRLHPGAYVHTLPCLAGHVGADCMAVALAEAPHRADTLMVIVDIGTNAEILYGDKRAVLAASSPTGPAFEGAQISSGQRAAPGAIERVRIDPATLEPRFKVIGRAAWSDEDGAEPLQATGICGSGIIEVVGEMLRAGIISRDGRFVEREHPRIAFDGKRGAYMLATAEQSATGKPITVTQDDVRAIQLAKAALYAGIALLRRHHGGEAPVRVLLAGGFGNVIDPQYVMLLGLIPDCDPANVIAVGNAAGDGARIALLNCEARLEADRIMRAITYIETATDPDFQEEFVNALAIPHAVDSFPHLAHLLPIDQTGPTAPRPRRHA